jgi:hypothetical protein
MSTKSTAAAVSWPDLARDLGIPPDVRKDMLGQRLVRPIRPPSPGRPTQITPEDAARVRAAWTLAAVVGVAAIVILRLLAGTGADVTPSGVTIPVPTGTP